MATGARKPSAQMLSLMARYGVRYDKNRTINLLRAIRDDFNRECVDEGERKFTLRDAELQLDGMLEAEFQSIAGA